MRLEDVERLLEGLAAILQVYMQNGKKEALGYGEGDERGYLAPRRNRSSSLLFLIDRPSLVHFMVSLVIPDKWQQEAVRLLREGKDVVVDAPTGAGKTYIFELLYNSIRGQAVFTVPTRALANDNLPSGEHAAGTSAFRPATSRKIWKRELSLRLWRPKRIVFYAAKALVYW